MKITPVNSMIALALFAGVLSFGIVGCATHDTSQHMQAAAGGAYPLKTCVVSGEDLGKEPYVFTHNGQTVKLCCKDCLAKFDKEPDNYMAKLAAAK
jgi:hypothetical protein